MLGKAINQFLKGLAGFAKYKAMQAKKKAQKKKRVKVRSSRDYRALPTRVDRRSRVNALDWAKTGKWVRVISSNVKGIKYDKANQTLYVQFKGYKGAADPIYAYYDVAIATARSMFNSSSMGGFVWAKLRDQYQYDRIKTKFFRQLMLTMGVICFMF